MTSKSNVMAGKPKVGGAVFRAPLGTAIPTDAKTPLPTVYKELGYVSSDGWSRQIDKAYESINAWGGDEVSKSRSSHSVGFSLTLIENLNENAQRAKWGEAAVTTTAGSPTTGKLTTVTYKGEDTDPAVWVVDMNDEGKLHRTVFANGKDTTESFEQTFSDSDVIGLPFEVTAYKDSMDVYFVDYLDDGTTVTA